jgi:hypothetical protein
MEVFLLLLALLGHAFLWIGIVNRLHALGIRRWKVKLATASCFLLSLAAPAAVGWLYLRDCPDFRISENGTVPFVALYIILCWFVLAATLLRIAYFRLFLRPTAVLRYHGTRRIKIDIESAALDKSEKSHHILARLPLNEILRLEASDWAIEVPRLAPALDGLSIVQLTDLHFTGRVGKAYFREVVRACNENHPDLVAVTGDIVDARKCLDWVADTLGRLVARHGVFFILGNHDLRVGYDRLRREMEQCGLIDLGNRCRRIEIHGQPVLLAGNELPWIDGQAACDFADETNALRIALSHSPDQLAWARAWNADLMLAGHTHGGQICIPPLGAILSPTWHGVKYISGVYHCPPTIMHVSRGISGDAPVRWNCPPEIAILRLRAKLPDAIHPPL